MKGKGPRAGVREREGTRGGRVGKGSDLGQEITPAWDFSRLQPFPPRADRKSCGNREGL